MLIEKLLAIHINNVWVARLWKGLSQHDTLIRQIDLSKGLFDHVWTKTLQLNYCHLQLNGRLQHLSSLLPPSAHRQRAAAGHPGIDSIQGSLHHCQALQPHASAPVCRRLSWLPGLHPRGGPVSEQRLGWSGCPGEDGEMRCC